MEILRAFFEYSAIGTIALLIFFLCLFGAGWAISANKGGSDE